MLITAFTMCAFAGVYALVMAMLGERVPQLMAALTGRTRSVQPAARRFSLA